MPRQTTEQNDMTSKMDAQAGAEEKEQQKRQIDEAATAELFGRLNADIQKRSDAAKAKAAEIAKVVVADADVAILAHELGVSKEAAKVKLQEKKGNLKNALTANLYLGQ